MGNFLDAMFVVLQRRMQGRLMFDVCRLWDLLCYI